MANFNITKKKKGRSTHKFLFNLLLNYSSSCKRKGRHCLIYQEGVKEGYIYEYTCITIHLYGILNIFKSIEKLDCVTVWEENYDFHSKV